jgi:hypothetical protein
MHGRLEQPTKFKLVIDIATAKVLGIAVAETVIALVDEVRGDHAQGWSGMTIQRKVITL